MGKKEKKPTKNEYREKASRRIKKTQENLK
jgi:hypothetical protein